jgi:hypothetical protein
MPAMNILKLLLLICLFTFQNTFSQKYNCGWYGKKTVAERNKVFPFNRAKKVVLISYLGEVDGYLKKGDTKDFNEANGIIKTENITIGNHKVSYKVREEIVIGRKSIDELSNIMVNYTLKHKPKGMLLISEAACYTPRNSILFLDEKDEVICNFEICFECFRTSMYPDSDINNYSQIEECYPRFELLKDFFRKNGVKYGLEDN